MLADLGSTPGRQRVARLRGRRRALAGHPLDLARQLPAPVHKLAALSDPESIRRSKARSAVNAGSRLLGLDFDQFTSAVLLPQGRFQRC